MLGGKDFAWTNLLDPVASSIPKAKDPTSGAMTPFTFVSTAGRGQDEGGPDPVPEQGVVSMGRMQQDLWWNEVASSKVMLGVGRPYLSPSREYGVTAGMEQC